MADGNYMAFGLVTGWVMGFSRSEIASEVPLSVPLVMVDLGYLAM